MSIEKKVAIATELAKFELNFQKEDYENQESLKKLLVKADKILEEVKKFVDNMMAVISEDNRGIPLSPELELDILLSLEKKVITNKEITSLQGMRSAETIKAITNDIINSEKDYTTQYTNITNNSLDSSTIIVGMTFAEFIAQNLTVEQVEAYESEYRNSAGYKQIVTSSMDDLFNAETVQEQESAAKHISAIELSRKSDKYYIENKGTKADRGILLKIFIFVDIGTREMMQEAAIKAKKIGFDIIKDDGSIDLEKAHKILADSYMREGKNVPERFATVENTLKTLHKSNEIAAQKTIQRYEKNKEFKAKYKEAKTLEEKMAVIKDKEEKDLNKKALVKKLDAALVSNNKDYKAIMKELAINSPNEANKIILKMASRNSTNFNVQADMVSFVNEVYGSKEKEVVKNNNPQLPKSPVAPKLEEFGDER